MLVHPRMVPLVFLHALLAEREIAVDADPLPELLAPVARPDGLKRETLILVLGDRLRLDAHAGR